MKYKKIIIAGGGVLGSQIAFQSAFNGYDVVVWLRSKSSVERAKQKLERVKNEYLRAVDNMDNKIEWSAGIADEKHFNPSHLKKQIEKTFQKIEFETDLKKAAKDADLLIESVSENKATKSNFYKTIAPLLEKKTVIVTNSSTFLPSTFASDTGRPEKFLALHFANSIWKNNTAEVMAHSGTEPKYFDEIVEFANSIRMIALPIRKEKSGYLLNSMLVPFLLSGLDLVANDISDPKTIDEAWTKGTGAPKGPMKIIDTIGLETALNIVEQYQKVPSLLNPLLKKMLLPYNFKAMKKILEAKIKAGKLGKQSGEGFYKYEI